MLRNIVVIGCLIVTALTLSVCQAAPKSSVKRTHRGDYVGVKGFAEAVTKLKSRLADSQPVYASLISEQSVRKAIETSIRGREREHEKLARESHDKNTRKSITADAKHFREVVKPIYDEMLRTGLWPTRAYFQISEGKPEFTTLSIQLSVETKHPDGSGYEVVSGGTKFTGYSIPILNVEFGDDGPDGSENFKLKFKLPK